MRYELEVETFERMWLLDHGYVDEAGMPSKESMTKLAEEAMESYSAWEDMRAARESGSVTSDQWLRLTHKLLDELADVIQAACNAAAICGANEHDMAVALWECHERNRRRGRLGGAA
jgi:neutral trehalase